MRHPASLAALLLVAASTFASAQSNRYEVTVNGERVSFDRARPQMRSGHLMVPLRGVLDRMPNFALTWDPRRITVTATYGEKTVAMKIGSRTAWINGEPVQTETPPVTIGGRTMIPLRFLSEALGAVVTWNNTTNQVAINLPADIDGSGVRGAGFDRTASDDRREYSRDYRRDDRRFDRSDRDTDLRSDRTDRTDRGDRSDRGDRGDRIARRPDDEEDNRAGRAATRRDSVNRDVYDRLVSREPDYIRFLSSRDFTRYRDNSDAWRDDVSRYARSRGGDLQASSSDRRSASYYRSGVPTRSAAYRRFLLDRDFQRYMSDRQAWQKDYDRFLSDLRRDAIADPDDTDDAYARFNQDIDQTLRGGRSSGGR